MGKPIRGSTSVLLHIIGGMMLLGIIAGASYLAHLRVQAFRIHFEAAIEGATRLGMLSQAVLFSAEKWPEIQDKATLRAKQKALKSLIRQMELIHLSLTNGTPDFDMNPPLAEVTRRIYTGENQAPGPVVGEFLAHANLLINAPAAEAQLSFQQNLQYLNEAVNRDLSRALGRAISRYKQELEARILEVWAILVGGVMVLLILITLSGSMWWFRKRRRGAARKIAAASENELTSSVATVLQPLSINDHSGALVVQALLPDPDTLSPMLALPAPRGYARAEPVSTPDTGFYLNIRRKKSPRTEAPVSNEI